MGFGVAGWRDILGVTSCWVCDEQPRMEYGATGGNLELTEMAYSKGYSYPPIGLWSLGIARNK